MRVPIIPIATLVVLLVASALSDEPVSNNTKPVVFLTSPPQSSNNASSSVDNGNSESRVDQQVVAAGEQESSPSNSKGSVNSRGYQLEVLEDQSEEAQERADTNVQSQKGSENQLNIFPSGVLVQQSAPLVDQYLQQAGVDYDDNSAKEDNKEYAAPKANLAYGDIQPRADISKVRDLFVGKEVNEKQQESKYKLEYENSPYGNPPLVLKQASLPLVEPHPLPHPQLHHEDISGHTAGYGHGFHHHQQKLKAKPLKPSVVYRDPSDRFSHHDKIRTLDKDHYGSHHDKSPIHPYGPHVLPVHKGHHEYGAYKYGKVVFKPVYYDINKIPECAHKNKYIYNLTFCLDDPHYPVETILYALKEAGYHGKKLLSDVTYQSADNLVTGLTRAEEEGYTYKHYFGATHSENVHLDKYKPPYQGYTYSTDYFKKGGYICPSDIFYARPKRAMNTFGKWKVIVNLDVPEYGYDKYKYGHGPGPHHVHGPEIYEKDHGHHHEGHHGPHPHPPPLHPEGIHGPHPPHHGHGYAEEPYGHGGHHSIKKREYKEIKKSYTQTLRLEQCIYPNAPCSYVDAHFHSHCIQKHNFVRLVAWTHDEGLHVDTFKMPIACSCHVRQPIHFFHESGHHERHEHGYGHSHHHGHHPEHHHEPHGHIKKLY